MKSHSMHFRTMFTFIYALLLAGVAHSQTFTTVYSFRGSGANDAGAIASGVVIDPDGNLYGTGTIGGTDDCGAVYKIDAAGNESVLYSFTGCVYITDSPSGRLIRDQAGNLYGTAEGGGLRQWGAVFKVDQGGTVSPIYNFRGKPDGNHPYAGLSRDAAGNLYGATLYGGAFGFGTVFVLDAAGNETVLHDFTGRADGANPWGNVIRDANRNLYGTTSQGGAGFGTVYKIDSAGQFTTLYTFAGGTDGGRPLAGLVRDSAGNLYGTTSGVGESPFHGTVFMLDPAGNETVLHNFGEGGGKNPVAGLARDSSGNLYGTAIRGGDFDLGTVFMLTAAGKFKVLHEFNGSDGKNPQGCITLDGYGNLYGTTYIGGPGGWGTVFKISR